MKHTFILLTDSHLLILVSKSLTDFLEDCDVIQETEDVDSGGESSGYRSERGRRVGSCALNQKGERTAFVQKYVLRSESGKMPDSITCHDWLRLQQLFYGHFKLSLFERMAKSAEVSSLLLK